MLWNLLAFTVTVALFHVSEFLLACIFMREELSWRSWLLSKPYCAAMGLAIVEFYAELWLAPGLKTGTWASPDCILLVQPLESFLSSPSRAHR